MRRICVGSVLLSLVVIVTYFFQFQVLNISKDLMNWNDPGTRATAQALNFMNPVWICITQLGFAALVATLTLRADAKKQSEQIRRLEVKLMQLQAEIRARENQLW
jgi:hypothetical protein